MLGFYIKCLFALSPKAIKAFVLHFDISQVQYIHSSALRQTLIQNLNYLNFLMVKKKNYVTLS